MREERDRSPLNWRSKASARISTVTQHQDTFRAPSAKHTDSRVKTQPNALTNTTVKAEVLKATTKQSSNANRSPNPTGILINMQTPSCSENLSTDLLMLERQQSHEYKPDEDLKIGSQTPPPSTTPSSPFLEGGTQMKKPPDPLLHSNSA